MTNIGKQKRNANGQGGGPSAQDLGALSAMFAQGRFADAAVLARTLTERYPQNAIGWTVLGVALSQMGRNAEALAPLQRATALSPGAADAHCNLGNTLQILGRPEEAEVSCRRALQLNPQFAEAHNNLGNALGGLGRRAEAEASYRSALQIRPDFAEAHNNLGNALRDTGRLLEALECYQRALQLRPDFSDACYNLANAFRELGRLSDAEKNYRRAMQLRPRFADAHYNLANTLRAMGRLDDAERNFRAALQIRPEFAEGYNNLGNLLKDCGQLDEAALCYRRALKINPDLYETHINLGHVLKDQGELNAAESSYRKAIACNANSAEARMSLVTLTLLLAPKDVAESRAITEKFDRALEDFENWFESNVVTSADMLASVCAQQPFHLAYRPGNQMPRLSRFGDIVERCADGASKVVPQSGRERLRLAIVTRYLYRHPVWYIILRGILEHIDRGKFELVLYQLGQDQDEETERARILSDVWRDGRAVSGYKGWMDALAEDRADVILYPSIGMDSLTLQLAAHRMAPLQVASWGHPMTTGLSTIDLYLSGEMLEPADADFHYREHLVRLPGTGCCTTPLELLPEDLGEIETELVSRTGAKFVVPQTPYKFDPSDDELIARIAELRPNSLFILLRPEKEKWASDIVVARLSQAIRRHGLVPEDHLRLLPWMSQAKFHRLLELCDVYLDCPSFSGYTTGWQAVHTGIPIVTREGSSLRQRLAAGLLREIGLPETIAVTDEDYVNIAVRLADECSDADRRRELRHSIKAAVPRMNNDIRVVRAFENTLIEAHARMLASQGLGSTNTDG
jgi:predicted O-linked N-acetylglucosamine transferase (SPINDLY family)